MHHALALGEGHHVPILLLVALAIHGVEAEVLCIGNGGPEARRHGRRCALERLGNVGIPLRRMRLKSLGRGGFVGLARGLVQAEFDDGDVRVRGREEVVKLRLREREFDLVQRRERVAEVHDDQVALVAELRVDGGMNLALRIALQRLQRCDGFARHTLALAGRAGPPGFPVEAKELMQDACAFKRQRDGREVGQRAPRCGTRSIVAKRGVAAASLMTAAGSQ